MKKIMLFACILFFGLQVNAYAGGEIQFMVVINEEGETQIIPMKPVPGREGIKRGPVGPNINAGEVPFPSNVEETVHLTVYILPSDYDDPCVMVGNMLVCW